MKYCKAILIFMLSFLLVSNIGDAANSSTQVGTDLSYSFCKSSYQDNSINTSGSAYFSRCVEAKCNNNSYDLKYLTTDSVVCTNGNTNPYYSVYKNGCSKYSSSVCNNGQVKYCSIVSYYDCSRTFSGKKFTTTTTTTTTKKKIYTTKKPNTNVIVPETTTSTTTTKVVNTKLSSLSFNVGSISFNPDIFTYDLNLNENINSIEVNAIPQDSSSKIEIIGNDNIYSGSQVIVKVTATNGSSTEYVITVNISETTSSSGNTKLKSLSVEGYSIPFSSNINSYSITVDSDVEELVINCETEDNKSVFKVEGNKNIKNGDKVTISVIAEDGTEGYYYINVNVKKKSSFLPVMFIIVLISAIIAGGYYIYKKIVLSKGGEKYEYE